MTSVRELESEGRRRLSGRVPVSPGREARLLLGHLLGVGEAGLLACDDHSVDAVTAARYRELLARRAAGEPIAYLTGRREFFGREFVVDPRVLVPRPETEHLVEIALRLPLPAVARVLDVGTGSGAVAVTLAAERPRWQVTGCDLSLAALAVARRNQTALAPAAELAWVAANLVSPLRLEEFDLVVSNLPYVDPEDAEALAPDVRQHEPAIALFAERGIARIEELLAAAETLRPGAFLTLEVGVGQAARVAAIARASSAFDQVEIEPDLAGIPRDVVVRRTVAGDG